MDTHRDARTQHRATRVALLGLLAALVAPPASGLAAPGAGRAARPPVRRKVPVSPIPPDRISVRPVFYVPKGEKGPSAQLGADLVRHLQWTQRRFRELLKGRDTFLLDDRPPTVIQGGYTLAELQKMEAPNAPYLPEVLRALRVNRYSCPHVLMLVIMCGSALWPPDGGRPFNGGLNTGGGFAVMSSAIFERYPYAQTGIQHELGHAFGLCHVDSYGGDMKTSPSIMSYAVANWTRGFEPSPTPGILLPEDLRALAMNKRLFPKAWFDPKVDVPAGGRLHRGIDWIRPMEIPGQPSAVVKISTPSGETWNSKVENIVQRWVLPDAGPEITYNGSTMWTSGETPDNWSRATLVFPHAVDLTGIAVHHQHSGRCNPVKAIGIHAAVGGKSVLIAEAKNPPPDVLLTFPARRAQVWTLSFRAGKGRIVTVRGLRFFSGAAEIFPPMVPYDGPAPVVVRKRR